MKSELQDAVTLAQSLKRTALQLEAKRVYDALCEAQSHTERMRKHLDCDLSADRLRRVNAALESAFEALVLVMHEEDSE